MSVHDVRGWEHDGRVAKTIVIGLLLSYGVMGPGTGFAADAPSALEEGRAAWPAPVPGFIPLQPGEHPRLLFRKGDLPAIKARARTPEGAKIVERLRATLGGGETMPTVFNKAKRAYDPNSPVSEGAFTISHIAGFGMLYQLTGDRKYAELGRQCFLKGKEGVRDRDNRYAQEGCDGQLRLGPSLAMIALGYDLCYDGWDEAFRKEVAAYLQNYRTKVRSQKEEKDPSVAKIELSLADLVNRPAHAPVSNHHGAIIGGAGMVVLALMGDPGTDTALLKEWDEKCQAQLRDAVPQGFGPYGFYAEGQGPSHVAVNAALLPYVQALRVAAGKDYVTGGSMVQWWTLRWVMEVLGDGQGRAYYPARHELMGSSYGNELMLKMNGGMTHGGWFSQGFGDIPDRFKPALLWTYNTFAAAEDRHQFDTRNYPHRAIMALVNWPLGIGPANPGAVMPKAICDSLHSYYVIRNRWQDADDVVITLFGKTGSYRQKQPWAGKRPTKVFGVGQRVSLAEINGKHDFMATAPDGSTSLRWPGGRPTLFAVDFSRRAGVDAVIVTSLGVVEDSNSYRTLDRPIQIGGQKFTCLTLTTTDQHPAIATGKLGDLPAAIVGGLAVTLEDGKLAFHDAPGAAAGLGAQPVDAKTVKKLFAPPGFEEKDVKLPADPCYALDFDSRYERDGDVCARNMAAGRRVNGKGDAILRNVTFVPGVLGQGVQVGRGAAFVPAEATETDFVRQEGFTAGYWLRVEEPVDSASFHFTRGEGSYSGYINGAFRSVFEKQFDVDCEIEPEAWHHVVWVADAREKRLTLWFDGAYRGSTPFDGKVGGGPATLGLGMMIRDEDVPDPFGPFDGSLDEVRFYRRPLAVGEVVALYREGAKAIEARQAGGNRSPSPVAVCSPNKGLPPLEVRFDASASSDPEEDNLSFAWDFGDGVKGAGAIVTHTYAKLGKYDARLTVTDARGAAATIEKSIRVQNEAPRLQVYPAWNWRLPKGEKAVAPDEVRLDASESVDPEGKPLRCTWSVADQTYTGAVVRARLPAPGAYPLTLVADDGTGRTTTWRGTVNLADAGGRCLAETPAEPLTPGLHFRYFHQGARHPGMDIEGHAVYPIEWNVLKHYGSAHVPLPWIVRARPLQYWIDWAGYLNAPADGDYTFHFNVKGGAFLWIGSRLVGNWYQGYGSTRDREFRDFTVKLQQGAHRFRLVYFAYKYENQNLAITWSGPGFTNQLIPSAAFNRSLSVAEQRAAGLANPRPGADVADWFQESNPPSEGPAPQPPPKIGRLELTVSDPAADGYVTVRAKAPADFVEPIEIVCHPGDGSRVAGAEFARVYPPGAYTITVEARDAAGRSAAAFRKIAVPAREAVESIGFVFTRGRDFLRPTSVAGVFPQGFWNASGPSSSGETVLDSQGRKVAVTLSSAEQLPWNPVYTGSTSPMEDQLLAAAGWFDARELSIRGIPYARYDLVLIAPGGWDAGVPASFAVTIGDQTRTVRTVRAPSDFAGRYVEETEANPEGNYLVFRGLTGTDQTIRFPKIITCKRPSICAVQIVKTK